MSNNTHKYRRIKNFKNFENIVQNAHCNSYYLNCKQTSIATIQLHFHGYAPV